MSFKDRQSKNDCITPIYVYNAAERRVVPFPCGYCINCMRKKINDWTFRLQMELQVAKSATFATLTYSDDYLPEGENGPTLVKRDLQLFFKRLRKGEKNKIKYFACGEYGGQTGRPHYHIILFNTSEFNVIKSWTLKFRNLSAAGASVPIGNTFFGEVNIATIKYVCGYMQKRPKKNDYIGREPEFRIMSKGIGSNYLTPQIKTYHSNQPAENYNVTDHNGIKYSMPRYYKDKIYSEQQRELLPKLYMKPRTNKEFNDRLHKATQQHIKDVAKRKN